MAKNNAASSGITDMIMLVVALVAVSPILLVTVVAVASGYSFYRIKMSLKNVFFRKAK